MLKNWGSTPDWLVYKSYLSNCNQYVSINGSDSGLATITKNCDILQGSVLGPLLFLLYINGPNQAIKCCKVHHFSNETNLLCLSNSIKKLKKLVNADLKYLVDLLNANKISPNIKKTEMVIFKSKQKKIGRWSKNKIMWSMTIVYWKCLNTNLSWQYHNIMLMICPLKWIEQMISFSKWENMLVLKY